MSKMLNERAITPEDAKGRLAALHPNELVEALHAHGIANGEPKRWASTLVLRNRSAAEDLILDEMRKQGSIIA